MNRYLSRACALSAIVLAIASIPATTVPVNAQPPMQTNVSSTVGRSSERPAAEAVDPLESGELPQYIFFNKAPVHARHAMRWSQNHPDTFTAEGCREIVETIGASGDKHLRVGVSFVFSILETDPKVLAQSLEALMSAAQAADVPVLITLDGQNWWQTRHDLWNFWDPDLAGYDPSNRINVEWTSWDPADAVKIGWRNWGRQIRVRPAPNIASPRFLAEHWKAYDVLIPAIMQWYRRLPEDRKYLFGGLKLGWEASINVNAYYYKDGNRILDESPNDASDDPTDRDSEEGWAFGNQPLGYAAVSTAKIKSSGTLIKEDIEQVVQRYLEQLCREAHQRGVPRHMIFTHQGGTYAPWDKHLSFTPGINEYSIPGWSFYSHDPAECGSLAKDMAAAGRKQWAASEWWRGAGTRTGWVDRFNATLRFARCRFVCVYNWESFMRDDNALAAVRELVDNTAR